MMMGFLVDMFLDLTDCFGDSTVTTLFVQTLQASQESVNHEGLLLLDGGIGLDVNGVAIVTNEVNRLPTSCEDQSRTSQPCCGTRRSSRSPQPDSLL